MNKHYQHKEGVIETDLDDEIVLLDSDTRAMFSLNESGRLIWQALPESGTEGAVRTVVDNFDVSEEKARTDVDLLVDELLKAKLLSPGI